LTFRLYKGGTPFFDAICVLHEGGMPFFDMNCVLYEVGSCPVVHVLNKCGMPCGKMPILNKGDTPSLAWFACYVKVGCHPLG